MTPTGSTPADPGPHDGPEQADTPAPLDDQVQAALDVCDEVVTVLDDVVRRVTALEDQQRGGAGPENRADYRFEFYPPAETTEDEGAQLKKVLGAWQRLDKWVSWLVATYKLTSVIPPCWPEHPGLREELIGLRVGWAGAWTPGSSHEAIVIWHEKLFHARARMLDGNWGCPRCDGRHEDTGLELAETYHAWADDPRRSAALVTARDRSIATVRTQRTVPAVSQAASQGEGDAR
jgi:hypothetical protein